jgi:hypothetical protein
LPVIDDTRAYRACWVPGHDGPLGDVFDHDGPRPDHGAFADSNPWADECAGSHPRASAYDDGLGDEAKAWILVVVSGGAEVRILRYRAKRAKDDRRDGIAVHVVRESAMLTHGEVPGRPDPAPGVRMSPTADLCAEAAKKEAPPRVEKHRAGAKQE